MAKVQAKKAIKPQFVEVLPVEPVDRATLPNSIKKRNPIENITKGRKNIGRPEGAVDKKPRGTPDKPPTIKQRRLADAVLKEAQKIAQGKEPASKSEIGRIVGYYVDGPEKAKGLSPSVWNAVGFQKALAERGITPSRLTKVLDDALEAKVVASYQGDARETDAPDHVIRLRAQEQLAKLTGLDVQKNINLNVNVDPQDLTEMLGL